MRKLRYTLVCDGSSNEVLIPVLSWLLRKQLPGWAIDAKWADLRWLPKAPTKLDGRISAGVDLYESDLLFVHRDAEAKPAEKRIQEILRAAHKAGKSRRLPPVVPVVPVRMQEAWLLSDERAIRAAAGNPNGRMSLSIPPIGTLEKLANPKRTLFSLLRTASGLRGRRLKKFRVRQALRRVAELTSDFSGMRELNAFRALENETAKTLRREGWLST